MKQQFNHRGTEGHRGSNRGRSAAAPCVRGWANDGAMIALAGLAVAVAVAVLFYHFSL